MTRTVSGEQRLANAAKEFHVRRQRLSRTARRTAENPRRPHGGEKDAVVARVAAEERAFDFGARRKRRTEECRLRRRAAIGARNGCSHTFTLAPRLTAVPPKNEHGIQSVAPSRPRRRADVAPGGSAAPPFLLAAMARRAAGRPRCTSSSCSDGCITSWKASSSPTSCSA